MSHGLLSDNVHTSLPSLLYSCVTGAVFSEVHDQWASQERRDALSLCGSWAPCNITANFWLLFAHFGQLFLYSLRYIIIHVQSEQCLHYSTVIEMSCRTILGSDKMGCWTHAMHYTDLAWSGR